MDWQFLQILTYAVNQYKFIQYMYTLRFYLLSVNLVRICHPVILIKQKLDDDDEYLPNVQLWHKLSLAFPTQPSIPYSTLHSLLGLAFPTQPSIAHSALHSLLSLAFPTQPCIPYSAFQSLLSLPFPRGDGKMGSSGTDGLSLPFPTQPCISYSAFQSLLSLPFPRGDGKMGSSGTDGHLTGCYTTMIQLLLSV